MGAVATGTAMYSQNNSQGGLTVATAFPQPPGVSPNLDLLQIIEVNSGSVLLNVDSNGTVHNPAVNPTSGTRIGQFASRLTSSATTAQLFADAFANPSNLDIVQIINAGGNIHYWLDNAGVAHGS